MKSFSTIDLLFTEINTVWDKFFCGEETMIKLDFSILSGSLLALFKILDMLDFYANKECWCRLHIDGI